MSVVSVDCCYGDRYGGITGLIAYHSEDRQLSYGVDPVEAGFAFGYGIVKAPDYIINDFKIKYINFPYEICTEKDFREFHEFLESGIDIEYVQ